MAFGLGEQYERTSRPPGRTAESVWEQWREQRNYSGIHSVEYDCDVEYGGRLEKIKLFFYTAKCRWAMRFEREAG